VRHGASPPGPTRRPGLTRGPGTGAEPSGLHENRDSTRHAGSVPVQLSRLGSREAGPSAAVLPRHASRETVALPAVVGWVGLALLAGGRCEAVADCGRCTPIDIAQERW
jgi:hypothetical protein